MSQPIQKSRYDEGFKAGQEDYAIGAGWTPADETLPVSYREGYSAGYFQAAEDADLEYEGFQP